MSTSSSNRPRGPAPARGGGAAPNMPRAPNILLVLCDQLRADAVDRAGGPAGRTPHLAGLFRSGTRFAAAYATCPICCPMRRTIMTGQAPATHGMVGQFGWMPDWDPPHTLPGLLSAAGYRTGLVGSKDMHLPLMERGKRYGFDEMEIFEPDYVDDFAAATGSPRDGSLVRDTYQDNDYSGGAWPHDERLHPTNWTTGRALRFLRRHGGGEQPFLLVASYLAPHPPLTPPARPFRAAMEEPCPAPVAGGWAVPPPPGTPAEGPHVRLEGEALRRCRAGYLGLVRHLDEQLGPLLAAARALPDTYVFFTTDHGEMLGEHYLMRKSLPYEGAARIPLAAAGPGVPAGAVCGAPAGLEDLLPTILDLAGLEPPAAVDGRSLAPWLRGEPAPPDWRTHLHGEVAALRASALCAAPPGGAADRCAAWEDGVHFLADGREKYVWFTASGREQFFDLAADPRELCDLASDPAHRGRVALWRERMVRALRGRPEGFVADGRLVAGRPYADKMPHLAEAMRRIAETSDARP